MSHASKNKITALQTRARTLSDIRLFFQNRGVWEVETPLLGCSIGTDPHLDFFEITEQPTRYLQTSPEFAMKRLLAAGSGPIFQITKAFRKGDEGRWHNPEFTILEWYRPGFSLFELIQEVSDLLKMIFQSKIRTIQTERYSDLFKKTLQIDPLCISDLELLAVLEKKIVIPNKINFSEYLTRDDALQLLMTHCIEPTFSDDTLYFVSHYPRSQAALARLDPDDHRLALRFEAYLGPIELANGYDELTDPDEQKARFKQDCEYRKKINKPLPAWDQRFLESLRHMPTSSGVAMGLDRVFALHGDHTSLKEIISFAWQEI